ncbi:hypothetical protein [Agromyces mariniharenae]|uniref:Uncharacterized protein n=1 Tax=Agromyces mariniharenae TaxID=2604423 RepID=A0A5S4VA17_9MICO|nr:hypothetical protein [Agromyces mariniharenae]TYL53450.1 hypothetical protein FYC51_07175 [Agromyces mariniharenae]
MNPAAHRVSLTVLVALAAVAVVAGIMAGTPMLERYLPSMPAVPANGVGTVIVGIGVIVFLVWAIARLARSARARSRRAALASSVRGELSCGIRSRLLEQRMNELLPDERVRLGARYSIVVDELGIAFFNGGRRPRRAAHFPWREVRTIRADSMVVGDAKVPVAVLRIRHHGHSVELPIILSAGKVGRYALADAPFFATVRSWKAMHRAALAAEGLELPPLTAPIPIITPAMQAAAAMGRR